MRPKTSVVTGSYNRPDYLAEALESVRAQTSADWEHLVYDNHSSDPRVLDVLREARGRDPERFFFTSPGGRGPLQPALYWNILLGLARGRYLTILDDDNRKRPTFLAEMEAVLDVDPSVDAVSCGWATIDADGKVFGEDRHWNRLTPSMAMLYQSNTIDSNALLFRREVLDKIGQFPLDIRTCEDWHFVIRLARSCKLVHLDSVLLDYRVHDGSRSRQAKDLGIHETWERIRRGMFTPEEARRARAGA